MSLLKIKLKADGLYIGNPSSEKEFVENLKQSLMKLGLNNFDENSFLEMMGDTHPDEIRISGELPAKHDAIIEFTIDDERSKITVSIIPPTNGNPLTATDIKNRLAEDGLGDFMIDPQAVEKIVADFNVNPVKMTFTIDLYTRPVIEVEISQEKTEAYITVTRVDSSQKILAQDILTALKKSGVVKGILIPRIREIEEKNDTEPRTLVARAVEPIKGKDGEIIYFFDAFGENKKPRLDEFGNADFRMLDLFESVNSGDVLCKIIPGMEGMPGYNVMGEEIPAVDGITPELPIGKDTTVNPNKPNELISSIDGSPRLSSGKVSVEPILNIRGDIGLATGNVDFVGSIKISGKISEGFMVKAQDDVYINETCESVTIESGKDIILKCGIRAEHNAVLMAAGDVRAKFLEGATVVAGGEVVVQEYCYHCNIKAGSSVKVMGKKGYVAGGRISAKNNVFVKKLGSRAAPKTEVFVNHKSDYIDIKLTPPQKQKLQSLMDKYDSLQTEIKSYKSQCDATTDENSNCDKENEEAESAEKNATRAMLDQKKAIMIKQLEEQKNQIVARIRVLAPYFTEDEEDTGHFVAVLETVHPNVLISIDNDHIMTKNEFCGLKFINRGGKIVMEPYEPGDACNDLQSEY
jgi:uncharacterized protein (DUF342 family)